MLRTAHRKGETRALGEGGIEEAMIALEERASGVGGSFAGVAWCVVCGSKIVRRGCLPRGGGGVLGNDIFNGVRKLYEGCLRRSGFGSRVVAFALRIC